MTEQKTMELVIRYEYEKEQLGEYKPMKFEKWLHKTLAQERVKSSLGDVISSLEKENKELKEQIKQMGSYGFDE